MKALAWILGVVALAAVATLWFRDRATGATDVERPSSTAPVSTHADDLPAPRATGAPKRSPAETPAAARTVAGRIVGPNGDAVLGARVTLSRLSSPWPEQAHEELETVLTDPDGRFRFRTLRDEDLVIDVDHEHLAHQRVVAPAGIDAMTIRLDHGFAVRGVVFDIEGRPAEGELVTVEPGPWSTRSPSSTHTAEDGTFTLPGLSVGPLGVARITVRDHFFAPATVSLQSVTASEPVRLQFTHIGLALTGRIVQSADPTKPVANAEVLVFPSTAWNGGLYVPYHAETDRNGRFRVTGLGVGSHTVVVRHPDFSTSSRAVMVGRSAAYQTFELVQRSHVGGRLVGDQDVAGVELRIETNGGELARAIVGPDGSFEFPAPLSVGTARIDAIEGTCAFARTTGREVTVTLDDAPRTELELEVQSPAVVEGRVVDQRGEPLPDVLVWTPRFRLQPRHPERWAVATDSNGMFRFRGLPVGTAELTVEHEDFAVMHLAPDLGEAGEIKRVGDVVLSDPGVIRGHVTRGGAPLAGAAVFPGRDRADDDSTVTGLDGDYELRRLPPGRYRILARWSTLPLQVAGQIADVESGKVVDGVDIEFPPGRRIEGLVTDSVGLPVAEARILVVGRPGAMTATDAQGAFQMEVPNGDIELEVLSANFRAQYREPVPVNEDHVRIRLPWVPHGSISARVLGLPGSHPVPRAFVRLSPLDLGETDDESVRSQRTITSVRADMPGGRLRLDLVPAGRSRLEIQAPGWAPFVAEVTVARGEELDLGTIRLEPGADVHGIVTDAEGEPIPGAWVHLGEPEDLRYEDARHTHTGRDGQFELGGVSPDATKIVVAADGWAPTTRELRIPDDLVRSGPLRIVLERGSAIAVQIVRDDQPVEDLRLIALKRGDELIAVEATDLAGKIRFSGLPAGTWTVALFGDREEEAQVTVDGSPRDYEVRLSL